MDTRYIVAAPGVRFIVFVFLPVFHPTGTRASAGGEDFSGSVKVAEQDDHASRRDRLFVDRGIHRTGGGRSRASIPVNRTASAAGKPRKGQNPASMDEQAAKTAFRQLQAM
jgi:hypothetical protein